MTKSESLSLPSPLKLLYVQVKYQLILLSRTARVLVSVFLLPILILWIRHTGNNAQSVGAANVTAANLAALGGVVTFGVMSACFSMLAIRLVNARENGTLKRLHAAPLPPAIYFAGQIAASIGLGLLAVVVTVLFGYAEHIHVQPHVFPALLIAVLFGALAWSACGTAISAVIRDVTSGQALLQAVLLPIVFFSGVFFTISGDPHWLATFSKWLPAEPFVDMLTKSVQISHGWYTLPLHDVLVLLAWTVISVVIAVRFFSWEPYRAAGAYQA